MNKSLMPDFNDKELLDTIFDAGHVGIWILERDLTIIRANKWVERVFSNSMPIVGKKCHEVFRKEKGICLLCSGTNMLRSHTTHSENFEFSYPSYPGEETRWYHVKVSPYRDKQENIIGVVEFFLDITVQKHMESELEQKEQSLSNVNREFREMEKTLMISRDKLKAVFDALNDPIVAITPGFTVESLNLAATGISGKHPRELVGISGYDFQQVTGMFPMKPISVKEIFDEMKSEGKTQRHLLENQDDNGPVFHELTAVPVIDKNGVFTLGIMQVKNVTDFKRMERVIRKYSENLEKKVVERTRELTEAHAELKKEKAALEKANLELLRLDRLRQDLTNMVIHDMKSPLAELMGNLDLLGYSQIDGFERETLDMALLGAKGLLRMIMNLLEIGRMQENRLQVNKQPLSFTELAEGVRDEFKTLIRLKGLKVEVKDSTGEQLRIDKDLFGRVLQNLLTNAITYTPEEGCIIMAAEKSDDKILLSVQDNGEGIPLDVHDQIFEMFSQGRKNELSRTSTGLGLAFCKMAVEAHSGKIWVESEINKGATFFIALPVSGD